MRILFALLLTLLIVSITDAQDSPTSNLNGFPLPPLEVITADNIDRIEYLARIGNGIVLALALDQSGTMYAASTIGLWVVLLDDAPLPLDLTPVPLTRLAINPNGTLIAAGGDDGSIRLYDVTQGALIPSVLDAHLYTITALTFDANGTRLASADRSGVVRIWEINGENAHEQSVHPYECQISALYFTPDDFVVQCTTDAGMPPLIPMGSQDRWQTVLPVTGFWQTSIYPRFVDTNTLVVEQYIQSSQLTPLTFDVNTGDFLEMGVDPDELPPHQVDIYSPDNQLRVELLRNDATVNLLRDDEIIARFFGHRRNVTTAAFNQDGSILFSGSLDMTINVYDATVIGEAGALSTLTGHTNGITGLAVNPDGTLLVSTSYDGTIRLWGVRGE